MRKVRRIFRGSISTWVDLYAISVINMQCWVKSINFRFSSIQLKIPVTFDHFQNRIFIEVLKTRALSTCMNFSGYLVIGTHLPRIKIKVKLKSVRSSFWFCFVGFFQIFYYFTYLFIQNRAIYKSMDIIAWKIFIKNWTNVLFFNKFTDITSAIWLWSSLI